MKPFLYDVAKGVAVAVTVGAIVFTARTAYERYTSRQLVRRDPT